MALPAEVQYGQVKWKAVSAAADTSGDPDANPDAVPVTGTVTFTPSATVLLANGSDPVTVIATPVTYTLDDTGVLRDSSGRNLVTLVATNSAGITPTGWTWQVSYRLNNGLSRGSFSFALPAGAVVDLTSVAPVSSSNGVPIIQGPAGPAGPGVTVPAGGFLVMATEDTAVADANPQYVWLILEPSGADTTAPAVPTGLAATPGNGQVALDWADVTADLARYDYRSGTTNPPTGTPVATGTTSAATVTGLTNGTAYWFQVRAVDAAGNASAWSAAVSATPAAAATAPGAPTGVTATAGNAQATVSWTAPSSNGGAAITDYTVQYSSDSGGSWATFADAVSTATNATVTGLTNGTAYVFRVAAINSVGTGAYSTASSPVTPAAPAQGTTPTVIGRTPATVTNVNAITVPLDFTPQVGDDIFFTVHVPTGSGNNMTATGFEAIANPAATSTQKMQSFYRRWQSGDNPATTCTATRTSGTSNMQAKVVAVRGLDPAAANLAALRATDSVVANVGSTSTSITLGPTAVPSQARVFGLALAFTGTAHSGGLTASAPYAQGGSDTTRSMSASAFITDGAAQTVTLGWTTANEAHGVLLVLKAAP